MLSVENLHDMQNDEVLFALYRAWVEKQKNLPGLSPSEQQRLEKLKAWRSKIVDTAGLIKQPHRDLLKQLRIKGIILEPASLRVIAPAYRRFHAAQDGSLYLHNKLRLPRGAPKVATAVLGVSGAGKDTILGITAQANPGLIDIILTGTSRKPRDGDDAYIFRASSYWQEAAAHNRLIEGVTQGNDIYATPIASFIRSFMSPSPIMAWRGDIVGYRRFQTYCRLFHVPVVGIGVYPAITVQELDDRRAYKGRTDPWREYKPGLEIASIPLHLDALISNWPPTSPDMTNDDAIHQTSNVLGKFLNGLIEPKTELLPEFFPNAAFLSAG